MKIGNKLKYLLERFLVRGAFYQLLTVAAMIGLVSVSAGGLIRVGIPDGEGWADAIWWAFLRLSDPGYLGEDTGVFRRTVSTALTVMGYVLFMGSLVAIMTQWLNSTMRDLERGFTPVVRRDHLLIVGWSERAGIVVREIFHSEGRVRRFLKRRGARSLHMVVLTEQVSAGLLQEMKSRVGRRWNGSRVTLRSGSALRADHLERADFRNAASIILPAADFTDIGWDQVDTRMIKALLSINNHPAVTNPSALPLAVAEILDVRKAPIAQAAYAGPIEIVAADALISRLMVQNIRNPGFSHVYTELLTHREGNELFSRGAESLEGRPLSVAEAAFPNAVLLGVIRTVNGVRTPLLNPPPDLAIAPNDRLILMAREYEDTLPQELGKATSPSASSRRDEPFPEASSRRRILVLGWSHKVPPIIGEFAEYADEHLQIDIVSAVPAATREKAVAGYVSAPERMRIAHIEGDYTLPNEIDKLAPETYDHLVLMGSDWLRSGEASDARTIVGYLLVQERLKGRSNRPTLLIELLDPANAGLLGRRPGEVLISPVVLSHMLAQVALRRELNAVFDSLFCSGGAEIVFRRPDEYEGLDTRHTFDAFRDAADRRGEIAMGYLMNATAEPELRLNPNRETPVVLSPGDRLVVLATKASRPSRDPHAP